MEKIKVVIYKRVSSKGQGESGLGLEAQDSYLGHFIKSSPKYEVIAEFIEVASAKSMHCKKRPELCKALELCEKNGYTLAVAKLDRLSRVTEDTLSIYERLGGDPKDENEPSRLISCDIPNAKKFTITLFSAFAERERMLISLRTRQALGAKKERGETWDRNNVWNDEQREKAIQTNRTKAEENENTIRAEDVAKDKREKGMTLEAIADYLNAKKFRTPNGKLFGKTSVKRLIEKQV